MISGSFLELLRRQRAEWWTQAGAAGVNIVASGTAITVSTNLADTNNNLQLLTIINQNSPIFQRYHNIFSRSKPARQHYDSELNLCLRATAMIRIILFLLVSCLSASAQTGQPIKQSGNVTPGHAWAVTTNGIAQDAGTAAIPYLTSIGTVGQAPDDLRVECVIDGAGIPEDLLHWRDRRGWCVNGDPAELPGSTHLQPFSIVLNGATYQFPYTVGGIVGPSTTIINDYACWANTVGTLLRDCGPSFSIAATQAASYHATVGTLPCGSLIPVQRNLQRRYRDFLLSMLPVKIYPASCQVIVSNIGVYTGVSTARGVGLLVSGLSPANSILYPGQTTIYTHIGNAWVETGYGRCGNCGSRLSITVTFFSDASLGVSSNDGLASWARAHLIPSTTAL